MEASRECMISAAAVTTMTEPLPARLMPEESIGMPPQNAFVHIRQEAGRCCSSKCWIPEVAVGAWPRLGNVLCRGLGSTLGGRLGCRLKYRF